MLKVDPRKTCKSISVKRLWMIITGASDGYINIGKNLYGQSSSRLKYVVRLYKFISIKD